MAEIVKAVVKNHIDTAANLTAANLTPYAGEITIESDTGYIKIGDGVNNWNSLEYTSKTFYDSTITGASDVSTELPDPSDIVGEITYTRSGSGAGKRILTVPSGVSVDWGDATVLNGTIELEGTGKVVVRASGGNIKVDEYEDYITDGADQKIWKYKDGTEKQKITRNRSTPMNIAIGVLFRSSVWTALTRYHTFHTFTEEFVATHSPTALGIFTGSGGAIPTVSLTGLHYTLAPIAYGTNNLDFDYLSYGRWRA